MQEMVKNQCTDMHKAVQDLVDWSATTNDREKKGQNKDVPQSSKQLPPIRNKIDIQQSIKAAQQAEALRNAKKGDQPIVPELDKFKRDSTAMPDYYKAWDKFGKQLDDLDEDGPTNPTPGII